MKAKKVLVLSAHPDDEVLGCGGTICKHSRAGDRVFTLILGEGVTSRRDSRSVEKDAQEVMELRRAAKKAGALMGVERVFLHNFPDNRFDSVDLIDIAKVIEKVKMLVKPDIVYTHYEHDINIDHQMVFRATMVAFRPFADDSSCKIYSFESLSSTEFSPFQSQFTPNSFNDISSYMEDKMEALGFYQHELRPYPHPRSLKAVQLNNQLWGVKNGMGPSEAFLLIRERNR